MAIEIHYKVPVERVGNVEVAVTAANTKEFKEALKAVKEAGLGVTGSVDSLPPEALETPPIEPVEPEEEDEPEPVKEKSESKPTDPESLKTEIQHLATTAIKDGKKDGVKDVLDSVGARRISEIPEEQYTDVLDQLRQLV